MADAPRVSPQAGKGGAELPAMGALLRHLQTQVAKAGDGAPVSAVAGVAAAGAGTLAGGVDQVKGTAAPAGSIRVGGGKAYIAVADTTETDTSGWKELTLA